MLVVGERGTGKELIASRLHYLSNRWDREFVKMNCAAISDSLLETELFGHDAGAFTGATRAHKGRFERADGGTLFLDELATTSMLVQEKILRVIEYGEFERVGGSSTQQTDVRLIAATNEDLPRLAQNGEFRQDLLDRLAFDVITLPPLRARNEDILLLAEHFRDQHGDRTRPGTVSRIHAGRHGSATPPCLARQHSRAEERDRTLCLPQRSRRTDPGNRVRPLRFTVPARTVGPLKAPITPAERPSGAGISLPIDLKEETQRFEVELINTAMALAKYNQKSAAELLGVTYHQLRGYLKKYELLKTDPVASDES